MHHHRDGQDTTQRRATLTSLFLRVILGVALTATVSTFSGCGGDQPQVVLYVSADEYVAREVVAAFEQRSGINVQFVGDTEAKKTTGLVQRLRAEADNPQADVFWSSEIFMTVNLAEQGIFEPYTPANTEDWPARYRDDEHRWYGFAGRARVIVYNPAALGDDELPETWMDLTEARFRDKIVMADPRFGTTGGHLAAMKTYWTRAFGSQHFYTAFLEGLAANNARLLPSGNAGVVDAVARGEAVVGMTDTDDVWAAQQRGFDVKLIYPRHDVQTERPGGGTLLIPNTVARVKDGPNPAHAKQLIDFLLSPDVERILAESVSHNVPLRPGLADEFQQYKVDDPLDVDYVAAAHNYRAAVDQAMRILTGEDGATQPNESSSPTPPADGETP